MKRIFCLTAVIAVCLVGLNSNPILADVVHDESIDGDLSNDNLVPSFVVTPFASNEIIGLVGNAAVPADFEDFFTVTIGANETLVGIFLSAYNPDVGGASGNTSTLFEMHAGATYDFANSLGDTILTTGLIGTNVLPPGPVGPGDYSFRLGEGSGPASYELSFVIATIPEPATCGLLGLMLLGSTVIRRKHSS